MARSVREPAQPYVPGHARRPDLVPPRRGRWDFDKREAQRHLREKERPWAPIAYAVFTAALLSIFAVAYTTYAFSKYRGVILPGVHVDQVSVSGLTPKQAQTAIDNQLAAIGQVPVRLTYHPLGQIWTPTSDQIGLSYRTDLTVQAAMAVGRQGGFFSQLLDRLPIHPDHDVPIAYTLNEAALHSYLLSIARFHGMQMPPQNAALVRNGDDFHLRPMRAGTLLDIASATAAVHAVLGSLSKEDRELKVLHIPPVITDPDAVRYLDRVEAFLNHTPAIRIGKALIPTSRAQFAPMLSFRDVVGKKKATIVMTVNSDVVQSYVSQLAQQIDRDPQNARIQFSDGHVQVLSPERDGRTLDQTDAYQKLTAVVAGLKPHARLKFNVAITKPPIDLMNAASLGIRTLLASGESSFQGAGETRLNDIVAIANALDNRVLTPDQVISFNSLVGTDWPDRVYRDQERLSGGKLVPGNGGAMQQVATTFLRALYGAGLRLVEHHAHRYRLPWYEPPVGLDAVVSPARNWDLEFANSTHKYLLIETHVEPIRQELYIYVYGPKLGWDVSVDKLGTVLKTYPHGPPIVRLDPSLAPGAMKPISWGHDGADTEVDRTIRYPNGDVKVDQLKTTYAPWQEIIAKGSQPAASPTPRASRRSGTAATPDPTPTATFDH